MMTDRAIERALLLDVLTMLVVRKFWEERTGRDGERGRGA